MSSKLFAHDHLVSLASVARPVELVGRLDEQRSYAPGFDPWGWRTTGCDHSKARLEVINAARSSSMVDQPDPLAELLSTIAARTSPTVLRQWHGGGC
jgi:hypothetical protein